MDRTAAPSDKPIEERVEQEKYVRFSLSQRIEHFVLLVSFSTLGITGLAQKFSEHPLGAWTIGLFGGIEASRLIHRGAAVVLMAVSIYHIVASLYRLWVLGRPMSAMPTPTDFVHLYQDVMYYIGRRKHKAAYGRYSYAEKVEYLAVVWGTVIMAITGFMMWNPIATTRYLPGEFIPAAVAAHGGEALLAVLAIILWHFYHVHIRHFNKSMFTGTLTREEMLHEHPAELARIEAGFVEPRLPSEVVARRRRIYLPIAAVLVGIMSYGLILFVTFEETALAFVPPGDGPPVFVPFTPTPSPTPLPTSTPLPPGSVQASSWDGDIAVLMENKCGVCHVLGAQGGFSAATYDQVLEGGASGPGVVPGQPDTSQVVIVQQDGTHPGLFSVEELQRVIDWIQAGAPEE
jgi:cytochrome b subunit of formate dehydrogenase